MDGMDMFMMEPPQIGSPDDRRDWLARVQQQSGIEMRADFWENGGINFSGMWDDLTGRTEQDAANKQRDKQYKYDKKQWDYNWKNTKKNYEHQKEVTKTARENNISLVNQQNASAQAEWQHQLAIDDYEYNQEVRAYNASVNQTKEQLTYNQEALDISIEAEKNKLSEKALQAAFDQQGLINDLFMSSGVKDFEKQATQLGLDRNISNAGFQEAKLLNNLQTGLTDIKGQQSRTITQLNNEKAKSELTKDGIELKAAQNIGNYEFQKQNSRINFEDALNDNVYTTTAQNQNIREQERQNTIAFEGLGLDAIESEEDRKFIQKQANAELGKLRAQYAHEKQEKSLAALEAQGKAKLGQAGASTGAAVVGILASLGRQMSHMNDAIVREGGLAQLKAEQAESTDAIKQRRLQQKGKALDEALLSTVEKASNELFKADSDLRIAGDTRDFKIGELDRRITDVADLADQEIKQQSLGIKNLQNLSEDEIKTLADKAGLLSKGVDLDKSNIANVLQHHRTEAAQKDEKSDFLFGEEEKKFKHNQDVLTKMLEVAAEETANMIKGLTSDKHHDDILAKASQLGIPTRGPTAPKPIDIPYTQYEDPMNPRKVGKPPKPIKGLKATGAGFIQGISNIADIAGNFMPKGSDRRLKDNIIQIGTSPSGLNIYEWNYIGDKVTERYRGVIAQDLISKGRQDAVTTMANGYLGVYYDKIDVNMERI